MELEVNCYCKNDIDGFYFQSDEGIFQDDSLRNQIHLDLHGKVVGNLSVNCWLGGVVTDGRKRPYYVFGHNTMRAQERDSRLSCFFTFAAIPFEQLCRVISIQDWMEVLKNLEQTPNPTFSPITLKESTTAPASIDDNLRVALAGYAADRSVTLEMRDTDSTCKKTIESLWRCSLFSPKTPLIVLVDEDTEDPPRDGWLFVPSRKERTMKYKQVEEDSLSLEMAYLYYAYNYVLSSADQICQFRRYTVGEKLESLSRDFGRRNADLLEQLLFWKYALDRNNEPLPTQKQAEAMLQMIQ